MHCNVIDDGGGVKKRLIDRQRHISRTRRGLCQAEHILHAVETWLLFGEPLGSANGAARKGVATVGAMNELKPLANTAEDHGVFADDVTGADGKQPNLLLGSFADDALPPTDADFVQFALQRGRYRTA